MTRFLAAVIIATGLGGLAQAGDQKRADEVPGLDDWQTCSLMGRLIEGTNGRSVFKNQSSIGYSDPDPQFDEDLRSIGATTTEGLANVAEATCSHIISTRAKPSLIIAKAYNYRGWARTFDPFDVYGAVGSPARQQFDHGITDFDSAIELQPDFVDAYNNRGATFYLKRDYELAIADFTTAIDLKPDDEQYYDNRGIVYLNRAKNLSQANDLDQAIADFGKAIELKSDFPAPYENRYLAFVDKGDDEHHLTDHKTYETLLAKLPQLGDAQTAYARGDYARAQELFRKLANDGKVVARIHLASMAIRGEGMAQDYVEAAVWYSLAAVQGSAQAQNSLGIMYKRGRGMPRDYTRAADWFYRAADQGYANAENNLGVMYDEGVGVPRDVVHAYFWFDLAAAQGIEEAGKSRDGVAAKMTADQIAEAQRLVQHWNPKPECDTTTFAAGCGRNRPGEHAR